MGPKCVISRECNKRRVMGEERSTVIQVLTIWVDPLNDFLHLCLCGVEAQCSENIADLV